MKKNYQPVGNRLLLKIIQKPKEQKTKGGIILPDDELSNQIEQNTVGEILSIGKDVNKTLDLEVGFTIKYAKNSDVKLEDGFVVIKDEHVQAIIFEDEEDDDYEEIDISTLSEPNKTIRVKKKSTL